jgi:very-short-patch-repair endonuclease
MNSMHPAVETHVKAMEAEAVRKGSYRNKLGGNEKAFLEYVWGPEFDYKFEGLTAEYPMKDYKGGDRFADFTYIRGSLKLLIEIDDFSSHAKHLSPGDFADHLMRQNDLVLEGWTILRFTAFQVKKSSMICRRQIKQAIGRWWVRTQTENPFRMEDRALLCRSRLIELALHETRPIRTADVARAFQISRPTALHWLRRFAAEGLLVPIKAKQKVVGYQLHQSYGVKA